jgi:hypothetical protein
LFRIRSDDFEIMPNIPERAGALQAAEKEINYKLTSTQTSCAMLLDPVREVDWAIRNEQVLSKDLKTQADRDAFLLQRRGDEFAEPCSTCAGGRGTFLSCVASPDIIDSAGNVAPYMPARVSIAFGTAKARSVRSILASPLFGNPISICIISPLFPRFCFVLF